MTKHTSTLAETERDWGAEVAEVVRQMERIAQEGRKDKEIPVPVIALGKPEATPIQVDEQRL